MGFVHNLRHGLAHQNCVQITSQPWEGNAARPAVYICNPFSIVLVQSKRCGWKDIPWCARLCPGNIRSTMTISSSVMNSAVKSERGLSSLLAFVGERKKRNTPYSLLVDLTPSSRSVEELQASRAPKRMAWVMPCTARRIALPTACGPCS